MAIRIPIISEFQSGGVDKAIRQFERLETTSQKVAFGLKKAFLPAAALTAGLGALAAKSFSAAENAATANARISEVATSMGLFGEGTENAGTSVTELTNRLTALAEATARQTGVDQNQIKLTQAKLLTFKELATTADEVGGAFDRATALAIDLAAAGFGEASTNAVQLGKALNDPIKGINSLSRSGITFTKQEKELIKTLVESGKTLEAQEIILKAVETQVGGTAEATANSSDKMKVAFSQLQERIGMALMPAIEALIPVIMGLFDFIANNTTVVLAIGAAVGSLAVAVVAANTAMTVWKALTTITAVANAVLGASFSALYVAMGVGVILAVIAALVVLEQKFGIVSGAVEVLGDIFSKVKDGIIIGVEFIASVFQTVWDNIKGTVQRALDAIKFVIDLYLTIYTTAFKVAWEAITTVVNTLIDVFQTVWDTITGIGEDALNTILGTVKAIINGIIEAFETGINFLIEAVNKAIRAYNKIPLAPDLSTLDNVTLPRLAEGGIVTGPTLALIGEAGPEAVVPLDRAGAFGNITINVSGSVISEGDLIETVRRGLVNAQRNGAQLVYSNVA